MRSLEEVRERVIKALSITKSDGTCTLSAARYLKISATRAHK